jgi:D-alanyl-D-alanine dipeptidase
MTKDPAKKYVYEALAAKMLDYTDYSGIPVEDKGEPLKHIGKSAGLSARQIGSDMKAYTGDRVYVRERVLERLGRAADLLAKAGSDPKLELEVVYGYRSLEVQRQLFAAAESKLAGRFSGAELKIAAHRLIAVPEVAGHPTGGAVDVQILQGGRALDFGTDIWSFEPDSFTYSPYISPEAAANRELLRHVMTSVGFAPFDGEWWHFSYGDKEWAKYYSYSTALYDQIEFKSRWPKPRG